MADDIDFAQMRPRGDAPGSEEQGEGGAFPAEVERSVRYDSRSAFDEGQSAMQDGGWRVSHVDEVSVPAGAFARLLHRAPGRAFDVTYVRDSFPAGEAGMPYRGQPRDL
jgi:hypothetical protein